MIRIDKVIKGKDLVDKVERDPELERKLLQDIANDESTWLILNGKQYKGPEQHSTGWLRRFVDWIGGL